MYGLLMDTTLNPKQTDPPNVLVARADEGLAHAHEQITRADEEIARAEEQLSKLEREAARHPSDHPQTRMNTFRPAVPGKRPSLGGRAVRGFIGLMLAACIGVAAFVWQSPYGDAAKQIIVSWVPQLVLTSSLPLEKPGLSAQPSPPTVQAAAATTAPPQPAPLAQSAREDVVPTAAALSPELTQLLQSIRVDAVAPVDGARSRNPGASNRTAQGQPGTNGPRHCQGVRAEPAAQDISASATADCHFDAQADAAAPVAASHNAAAGRKNAVVIGAAGADAPALARPRRYGERWR